MSELEMVLAMKDAHTCARERITSYYWRYVETMWGVVVLHNKTLLGDDMWPDTMTEFEGRYQFQVYLEHELCSVVDREEGLDVRSGLDETHEDLEYDLIAELLAQRSMSIHIATQLQQLSTHRLERHRLLRKRVRFDLDSSSFYVDDAFAGQEKSLTGVRSIASTGMQLMSQMYPGVAPL